MGAWSSQVKQGRSVYLGAVEVGIRAGDREGGGERGGDYRRFRFVLFIRSVW